MGKNEIIQTIVKKIGICTKMDIWQFDMMLNELWVIKF